MRCCKNWYDAPVHKKNAKLIKLVGHSFTIFKINFNFLNLGSISHFVI